MPRPDGDAASGRDKRPLKAFEAFRVDVPDTAIRVNLSERDLICLYVEQLEWALDEAERVLRVISGWNTDRVSAADAIQPALGYLATKALAESEAEIRENFVNG